MRSLLIALQLALLPGPALAQAPSPLQRMGAWAQQLAAAQQPITDAHNHCSPIMQQMQSALQTESREELTALLSGDEYRGCLQRTSAAAEAARDNLTRMEPLPAELERSLGLDTRDILRRSAASVGGIVGYSAKIGEAIDAFMAGDTDQTLRRLAESRQLAGSLFDGQIVLLESVRASLPLQTHKSLMDLRLSITRGMRVLAVADPASESGDDSAALRMEGARTRSAAQRLRANWSSESAELRRVDTRLGTPSNAAMYVALDEGIEAIAGVGDGVAASLEGFPPGQIEDARAMEALRVLAESEMLIMERARRFAVAASQAG